MSEPTARRAVAVLLAVLGLVLTLVGLGSAVVAPAGAEEPSAAADTSAPTSGATSGSPAESTVPSADPTDVPTHDPTEGPTDPGTVPTDGTTGPTALPTDPTTDPGTTVAVDDAELRWGINLESNTAAYAPGTYNFFSAGRIADPGKGGQQLPRRQWRQSSGDVRVEKWSTRTSGWRAATWSGLRQDLSGGSLSVGEDSGHTFVFSGGVGEVDTSAGTARIAWEGDVTVLYYSGYSFFYLSAPVLEVAGGRGTITAELSGFASSLEDQTKWEAVPAQRVRIATLPAVEVTGDGFSVEPAYAGVRVSLTQGTQVTDVAGWGAFPQAFVSYMERLGTGAFWYSSGGAADSRKAARPVTVSFDAATAVQPTPTVEPTDTPTVENTAPTPPIPSANNAPGPAADPLAPGQPAPPVAGVPGESSDLLLAGARPVTPVALTAAGTTPAGPVGENAWMWWGGGLLLLAAAGLLLLPPAGSRR
ncbi:HtaA domain-containing protein [Nocardioides sambongensis]|uniref:HtaA domain-containing protein n=1 Tax=Nocardioides sambongensis TaxID=2589074 RepID=UPI0015E82C5E|nr:HtaA domain-containing protein [Nocardioides sambongensis]